MTTCRLAALAVVLLASRALPCGWYYETFAAETGTLPCAEVVALDVPIGHSKVVTQRSLDIAELASALFPSQTGPLDARTNLLLKLGDVDAGITVARTRAALEPNAYASHANLGTALTLAGDVEGALREVRAALAIEPNAHFGQEQLHLQFLEYLVKVKADAGVLQREDLLGLSPTTPLDAGTQPQSREALVAMLGVSGGRGNPHLLFALGNVLRLEGQPRLAFLAWRGALIAKHPNKPVIRVMEEINEAAHEAWVKAQPPDPDEPSPVRLMAQAFAQDSNPLQTSHWGFKDQYTGLWWSADHLKEKWDRRLTAYLEWEERQLKLGTPFWSELGARLAVQEQRRMGFRCATSTALASSPTPDMFSVSDGAKPSERALAWLDAVEAVTDSVNDRDTCEVQTKALTQGFSALKTRSSPEDRQSLMVAGRVRQRWLDAFDRMAVVLARCAPKKGNGPVVRAWVDGLTKPP